MDQAASGLSVKPEPSEAVRAWYRAIGTGWRLWSSEQRSLLAKITSERRWAIRRQRYGPSGQRDRSYKLWLEERGKQLPDELKV
jgi:hypothetical protein